MASESTRPSFLRTLECSHCGLEHDPGVLQGLCTRCGRPLLARYDLGSAKASLTPQSLQDRPANLWRYAEVLPCALPPVQLGEGWTPLLKAGRLAAEVGCSDLWLKDESRNPTGSFKARGLSVAVSMARERGVSRLAIPTAGNAGLALAAYASAAGLGSDVFCPSDTPPAFVEATRILGARVHLVPGVITDCARLLAERSASEGWMDVSTLKEPYRVEGKKTMGYELFEQFGGRLPDVIVYPTGGGTGLVGMWKAFQEMEELGWIGPERPRMISVQAEGCAPIVRAWHAGQEEAVPWENPSTLAAGLRVPSAVGDRLMLAALRESGGTALVASDDEMVDGVALLGRLEGVLSAPEGGATVAALRKLLDQSLVRKDEKIVLFITGSALAYLEVLH